MRAVGGLTGLEERSGPAAGDLDQLDPRQAAGLCGPGNRLAVRGPLAWFAVLTNPPDRGVWQPTASCPPAGGILLHWRNVTPFGILGAGPVPFAAATGADQPQLHSRLHEVKTVGGIDSAARTPDHADVARFYNVVLAVGVWNPVTRQASMARALSLSENARLFALLNMAISDGLVAVMDTEVPLRILAARDRDPCRRYRRQSGYRTGSMRSPRHHDPLLPELRLGARSRQLCRAERPRGALRRRGGIGLAAASRGAGPRPAL